LVSKLVDDFKVGAFMNQLKQDAALMVECNRFLAEYDPDHMKDRISPALAEMLAANGISVEQFISYNSEYSTGFSRWSIHFLSFGISARNWMEAQADKNGRAAYVNKQNEA
jgi:hypothetical protein